MKVEMSSLRKRVQELEEEVAGLRTKVKEHAAVAGALRGRIDVLEAELKAERNFRLGEEAASQPSRVARVWAELAGELPTRARRS